MDGAENTVHLTDRAALLISPMFLASAAKIRAARGHDLASGVMARNMNARLSKTVFPSAFYFPFSNIPIPVTLYLQSFIGEVEISVSNIVMVALFGVWFVIRAM